MYVLSWLSSCSILFIILALNQNFQQQPKALVDLRVIDQCRTEQPK